MMVRPVDPGEIDPLAQLWHDCWQDAHAKLAPRGWAQARTLPSFRDRLVAALAETRVAGPVGAPTGLCMLKNDELNQLYVARAARGSGVAAALIDDGEARLAERGVTTAWLACAVGRAVLRETRLAPRAHRGEPAGDRRWRLRDRHLALREIDAAMTRGPLRQLGHHLAQLGLGPGARRPGANVSVGADPERKLRDAVVVRCVDDRNEIVLAGREIDLLDHDADLLGEGMRVAHAFRPVLDGADALFGPVHRHDEERHGGLLRMNLW
jgi:GNAT superfamily N-acetyltransferase